MRKSVTIPLAIFGVFAVTYIISLSFYIHKRSEMENGDDYYAFTTLEDELSLCIFFPEISSNQYKELLSSLKDGMPGLEEDYSSSSTYNEMLFLRSSAYFRINELKVPPTENINKLETDLKDFIKIKLNAIDRYSYTLVGENGILFKGSVEPGSSHNERKRSSSELGVSRKSRT